MVKRRQSVISQTIDVKEEVVDDSQHREAVAEIEFLTFKPLGKEDTQDTDHTHVLEQREAQAAHQIEAEHFLGLLSASLSNLFAVVVLPGVGLDRADTRDHIVDKLHTLVVPHGLSLLDASLETRHTHLAEEHHDPEAKDDDRVDPTGNIPNYGVTCKIHYWGDEDKWRHRQRSF